MSDVIIHAEGLSKRYFIGHQAAGDGLRHKLESALRDPFQWWKKRRESRRPEEFWALRDVSFKVERGEAVGIIGRNGAGKSTLLKVLSRITEPTTGRFRAWGRVASLLEVGTGFHPELTGRENVFLNGAILGMSKLEIKRKFDAIVEFSEIEKFLDTPVKRYSSGMFVRLAFAVAAHLDPEILIVDEVLAVGDAQFQKKCLRKMSEVVRAGRTIFFVSHNMQAVTRLCARCILLHKGEVKLDGSSQQVADAYLHSGATTKSVREWPNTESAPGNEVCRLRAVRIRTEQGAVVERVETGQAIGIELEYDVLQPGHVFLPHYGLRNDDGVMVFVSVDLDPEWRQRARPAGHYLSTGWIPGNLLTEGLLSVVAVLMTLEPEVLHAVVEDVVAFRVVDPLSRKDPAAGQKAKAGVIRPPVDWSTPHVPFAKNGSPVPTPAPEHAAVEGIS